MVCYIYFFLGGSVDQIVCTDPKVFFGMEAYVISVEQERELHVWQKDTVISCEKIFS